MSNIREVIESPLLQGKDESIAYTITTTPWGSTPASLSMVVYDITDGVETDVTSTTTTGSISAASDVITTKRIQSLTSGHDYRVEVRFTDSGSNTWEPYFILQCRN